MCFLQPVTIPLATVSGSNQAFSSVSSGVIAKTLQVRLSSSAKLNNFRRPILAPATDIAAIANALNYRPNVCLWLSQKSHYCRNRLCCLPAQVCIANHMISVVEIVLRKLQRPVVTDAPQFQLRSFGVPPPVRPKQPMTVLSQEINIFGEHHVARISDHMDKFQLWKSLC